MAKIILAGNIPYPVPGGGQTAAGADGHPHPFDFAQDRRLRCARPLPPLKSVPLRNECVRPLPLTPSPRGGRTLFRKRRTEAEKPARFQHHTSLPLGEGYRGHGSAAGPSGSARLSQRSPLKRGKDRWAGAFRALTKAHIRNNIDNVKGYYRKKGNIFEGRPRRTPPQGRARGRPIPRRPGRFPGPRRCAGTGRGRRSGLRRSPARC